MTIETRPAGHPAPTLAYTLRGVLYLNLTNRCSLRCEFCQRLDDDFQVGDYDLRLPQEPTAEEVLQAVGRVPGYQEVVFCGLGEPTLRLDVLCRVARVLRERGARTRLNTNGLGSLIEGRDIVPELAGIVHDVSISLTAQDESSYVKLTNTRLAGAYQAMLDFATRCKRAGMNVTLTAIDGLPEVDIPACERIAKELGVAFRRRTLGAVG